jgi:hypothetical protein
LYRCIETTFLKLNIEYLVSYCGRNALDTSKDLPTIEAIHKGLNASPVPLEHLKVLIDKLNKKWNLSAIKERKMIVKAMQLSQGHWFKCPNGHIYCISDCGGAMEESKCNECGARIGGQHHQLRRDNEFAPEMDGAKAPAWPTTLQ